MGPQTQGMQVETMRELFTKELRNLKYEERLLQAEKRLDGLEGLLRTCSQTDVPVIAPSWPVVARDRASEDLKPRKIISELDVQPHVVPVSRYATPCQKPPQV